MKKTSRTLSFISSCLVVIGLSTAGAQDWPQWRGPDRSARASGFNAPDAWPSELNQKWKVATGPSDATPALVGDKLYVFYREGGNEVIRCLNVADGSEVWQNKYAAQPAEGPAGRHPGPRSSPAVAEGKVVTYGVRGTLSCLDAATGKLLWRKDDFSGAWPRFFTSSSPIIVESLCVAQLGKPDNGGVVAYDLNTGDEKWRWTGDGPAYASPVLLAAGGTSMIVAETDSKIVGLGVADGKLLWETSYTAAGRSYNAATPIVDGQRLILCSSGRGATALKLEKQGDDFSVNELWNDRDDSVQFNTPVLKDGLLYGISQRGELFCKDGNSGETVWTHSTGERDFGSVVDAGSVLIALGPSAQLIVFEPGREYKELATYKVADSATYAYPVLSGNRIIVADQDSVILWTIE